MNQFVHRTLHHFLMGVTDGDGNDLAGSEETQVEQEEVEEDDPDSEAVLTIAGEKQTEEEQQEAEAEKTAPKWVKDLRQQHREAQKELRELRSQVAQTNKPANTQAPVLGKKPAMEDEDVDWDVEKFEQKLEAWHDRKREIERHETDRQQSERQQKEEWDGRMAVYATAKTALKFKDFDDAEDNARNALDVTQQGIIIQGADNSALIVYALGKNPKKAAELAAIKDPIKFAFAVAKLETKLKVESKKVAATAPERVVTGKGASTSSSDSTLDKLREEANRTGDMSKVMAYKRSQKAKQK